MPQTFLSRSRNQNPVGYLQLIIQIWAWIMWAAGLRLINHVDSPSEHLPLPSFLKIGGCVAAITSASLLSGTSGTAAALSFILTGGTPMTHPIFLPLLGGLIPRKLCKTSRDCAHQLRERDWTESRDGIGGGKKSKHLAPFTGDRTLVFIC